MHHRFQHTVFGSLFAAMVTAMSALSPGSALAEGPAGQIALSFDDAPRGDGVFFTGPERTEALITALASVEVEGAMIFVLTGNIEKHAKGRDRLEAYVAAGHVLANHTHTHPFLRESDAAGYLADIDRAADILDTFKGTAPVFRFPYLDQGRTPEKRDLIHQGLAARGLSNGYVTVDNYDWYMNALVREAVEASHEIDMEVLKRTYVELMLSSINFYDSIARDTLDRTPPHILLLHENDLAALFIDDLVRAIREQGWQVIPALQAYDDPIARTAPDTTFNGQGRVAAIAHAQGHAPRALVHESEDEDWLRELFITRGLLPAVSAN